jgi:hypothetical protein
MNPYFRENESSEASGHCSDGLISCSSTARHSKNTIQWPQTHNAKLGPVSLFAIRVMSEVQIVLLRTRGVQLIRAAMVHKAPYRI